jgi:hypothetical protein
MSILSSVFLPIGEEEEFEIVEEEDVNKETHPDMVKTDLQETRARTVDLAYEAESSITELQHLLGKTKTGTATCAEKD